MKKTTRKTAPLKQAARDFLANKSDRELARLLGPGARPDTRPGRGKPLSASSRWQAWETDLLGKCSDAEAARRTGRTIKAINHRRRILRIQMFNSTRQLWKKWEKDLLGKISDTEFARRTGRKVKAVQNMRGFLGIERFGGMLKQWTKRELALLGKSSDATVARRVGRSKLAVKSTRRWHGIAGFKGPFFRRTSATGAEGGIWQRPWNSQEIARLGTMPDTKLARQLHRPIPAVKSRRKRLGIPCFGAQRKRD